MIGGERLAQEFGDAGVAGFGDALGVGNGRHHDHRNVAIGEIGGSAQLAGKGDAVHAVESVIDDQDIEGAALEFDHGALGVIGLADVAAAKAAGHAGDQRGHMRARIGDQYAVPW